MVQISRKGQFFIIMLVFMAVIVAEVAIFTSESKQLQRQLALPAEPGVESEMAGYVQELKSSLEGEVYTGQTGFVEDAIADLEEQAAQAGHDLTIDCTESQDGDTYSLDCDLKLITSVGTFTDSFSHSITLSTAGLTLYNDEDYSEEDYYYDDGETVYYTLKTNNDNKDYNITLYNDTWEFVTDYPIRTTNFNYDGEFDMNQLWPDGEYYLYANKTGGTALENVTLYYNYVVITLTIKDGQGEAETQFEPGDTVYWYLDMELYDGTDLDTGYGIVVYHADGKPSDYSSYGDTSDGFASGSFTLADDETEGTMELVVTDETHGETDTTYIEVLVGEPEQYLGVVIPFNEHHNDVWSPGTADSGYTSWYDEDETTYQGVPFTVVEDDSEDDVVSVEGTVVFSLPRIKSGKIHFLTASSNPEDCA